MDGTRPSVKNWVRTGSHTASEVQRIASHALHPYPANHAAPKAIFMLTDHISSFATVAVAGMHGRSPSVAALRLVDVRPRTGAKSTPATPRNAHPRLEIAHEEPVTERRSQPVPVSREPREDPRCHGANVR